ncbi:MAG: ATP-binding protein [Chitinivibrionales bacterium]
MRRHSNAPDDRQNIRNKIIGLGERSFRKSYYPELQRRFEDLERFRDLLNKTSDAIFVIDKESGRIIDVNESAGRSLNYTPEELLQISIFDITHTKTHPQIRALLAGTEGVLMFETYLTPKKGKKLPFEVAMHTTKYPQALAIARNIAERRRNENALKRYSRRLAHTNEDLQRAYRQLQRIDEMKTEFISLASHELRTPITSVLGFAQTLLAPDINLPENEKTHYLRIIEKEACRLKNLVSDLLDLSRIERGSLDLSRESVNLFELIENTVQNLIMREKKHIVVHSDVIGSRPVLCDKEKMCRAVLNIVENALRYATRIEIQVSGRGHTRTVRITDNGPGISAEHREKVFEKFYRVKEDKNPGQGSGLGLAIAKEIIELHGGQIKVDSPPGQGASFFFSIRE